MSIARSSGACPDEISAPIRTLNDAATVLWLLGVPRPSDWIGQPVESAFTPVAGSVAPE